jgi:hypothetical protein
LINQLDLQNDETARMWHSSTESVPGLRTSFTSKEKARMGKPGLFSNGTVKTHFINGAGDIKGLGNCSKRFC